jgi:mono/diheme cytochrome c family protein
VACAVAAAGALAFAGAGCGSATSGGDADLVNGKELFIGEGTCGGCHALERAGTRGTQGPDLDQAFLNARENGMKDSVIEGVVREQIAHPRRSSIMKPDLVTGDDARDVAAYVAAVAGAGGEDTGLLASVGGGSGPGGMFATTCGSCHVLEAAGTSGTVGPNLDDLGPDKARVLQAIASGPGAMPEGLLSGEEADAVAAFVAENAGK